MSSGEAKWQPISSAPKDGTRIMAWQAPWEVPSQVYCLDDHHASGEPEGWFTVGGHRPINPTHWMPTPPPPTEPPAATPDTEKCEVCGATGNTPCAYHAWEKPDGCTKANPSPPTQPDRAKKTDQNFSTSENNKETLPVPIQGEGPYRAESAPKVGWDIYGPDGHERRLHEITIPTYVNDLNAAYQAGANSTGEGPYKDGDEMTVKLAGEDYTFPLHGNAVIAANVAAYQAGASSKDQVVEAAGLVQEQLRNALDYGEELDTDDMAALEKRLATALNPNSETEK